MFALGLVVLAGALIQAWIGNQFGAAHSVVLYSVAAWLLFAPVRRWIFEPRPKKEKPIEFDRLF